MVTIFALSVQMSLLAFAALGGAFFLFGRLMLHIFAKYAERDPLSIPVGAFVATVATAWALALGFVAADIWAITAKANQATRDERSAIIRLIGIADSPEIDAPPLREVLIRYRNAVVDDEWVKNINLQPAGSVEKSLQDIRDVILKMSKENIPGPVISYLLSDLDILQDARSMRLSIGTTSVDSYRWYLVISLTIMTVIAISSTHSDRVRAGIVALLIYTVSATLCLWILAIHANPYQGIAKIEPTILMSPH
ncbi:bestrophin-like domain [Ochrobactrum teleogrylli]|uniref:DUF4239 domain-containing protein n=1 Tax=Ochrobactrum teleogrylli TaxID=2479765 RepID=A0ABD5K4L5_9HYPH